MRGRVDVGGWGGLGGGAMRGGADVEGWGGLVVVRLRKVKRWWGGIGTQRSGWEGKVLVKR